MRVSDLKFLVLYMFFRGGVTKWSDGLFQVNSFPGGLLGEGTDVFGVVCINT